MEVPDRYHVHRWYESYSRPLAYSPSKSGRYSSGLNEIPVPYGDPRYVYHYPLGRHHKPLYGPPLSVAFGGKRQSL